MPGYNPVSRLSSLEIDVNSDLPSSLEYGGVNELSNALNISSMVLITTIQTGESVNIPSGRHLQYILGSYDNEVTVDGELSVDGSFLLMEL